MGEEEALVDLEQQRAFYGFVRKVVISMLFVLCFYVCAHSIVRYFRVQKKDDEILNNEEEAAVYKITSVLCTVAVTVSLSSMFLLPSSIISNEIRHLYHDNFYVKWLDTSLIRGLWNLIFLGSNISLFLLLPFAYFFYEAEGLPGTKKGVMSRVYEAIILLIMVGILVLGTVWVADALTLHLNATSVHIADIQGWLSYIPFLYSCMSMLGVLLTSMCTPNGFSHLFIILGKIIVQPELHIDVDQELERLSLEEASIKRSSNIIPSDLLIQVSPLASNRPQRTLEEILEQKKRLVRHLRSSIWERHFLFPLCFILLLSLTFLSLLLVAVNVISLILSPEHLPKGAQEHIYSLGEASTSYLGPLGALIEVILIIYMIAASFVGFYNTPLMRQLLPVPHNTSIIKIILNSIVLLVLSSAIPVMVRVLGITKYNLLGHFNSIGVLHNFWLVFTYNVTFFTLTCSILFKQATQTVIKEVTYLLRDRVKSLKILTRHKNKKRKDHED